MPDLKKNALEWEWKFRDATQQELLKFKEELRTNLKNLPTDKHENLKEYVLKKIKLDKGLIQALNDSLKTYAPGTEATWSLKTNKMLEILEGTISFIDSEFDQFIKSIKDDSELTNYQIKTCEKDVTIIANDGPSIYGTSKSSFFKNALITTYLVCTDKKSLCEITLNDTGYWIDQTPNAHVTPLPENLIPENIKVHNIDFTQCTYFYKDGITSKGLAFIHSGYAFGGYRNESRYPYQPPESLGKPNGPEDCSSFIGKLTLAVDQMSTADLWKRWQYQRAGYPSDQVWENSNMGKLLINKYTVIAPDNNIQPGDIWATRSFDINTDPKMEGFGKGGHTVLVIDDKNQKEVIGLGFNRDMPRIEGFGKQTFPKYPEKGDGKRIFFFRPQSEPRAPQESKSMFCCNII
jgi:hypothetical protein